jgi:hypothetical protein
MTRITSSTVVIRSFAKRQRQVETPSGNAKRQRQAATPSGLEIAKQTVWGGFHDGGVSVE